MDEEVIHYNGQMGDWRIRVAQPSDRSPLAKLQSLLWPDAAPQELMSELDAFFGKQSAGTLPKVILVAQDQVAQDQVAQDQADTVIGFLEVGLRSHADGCDPHRPVGFVEGWFVQQEFRHRGVGRELMRSAEDWARAQGCLEMGDNDGALRAHQALEFEVVDRCVHFRKSL